jgi:hypothetical protein
MKRESTTSTVALVIALVTLFVVYISSGTTQTTVIPSAPDQEKEVSELKKHVALLEERINLLLEWHAQPRIHKETHF